jgi:RNA polymerase sigma-70 factor (ECF subfamily)
VTLRPRQWQRETRAAPAPVDDGALLAGLRAGDLDAVAMAYDRWHQRVRSLARHVLADEAAAEDVVQEAFVALPRAASAFRGEVSLESFLLAIAVKRSRHHLRSVIRRRRMLDSLSHADPAPVRDPEQQAYRRQLAGRLARALDRLSSHHRVAFVLCDVEELTSGEAARLAGVPEPTMRTRLFHARRRLRELLAGEHDE